MHGRAASLGDLYAPKRIFSCNTASKCHSRRQPCCGILSCLAEKSLTLECFAVLKVRFFSYRKTQRTKKYWMYFKDDRLSVRKKILSKPCKSLSESAQCLRPFSFAPQPKNEESTKAYTQDLLLYFPQPKKYRLQIFCRRYLAFFVSSFAGSRWSARLWSGWYLPEWWRRCRPKWRRAL